MPGQQAGIHLLLCVQRCCPLVPPHWSCGQLCTARLPTHLTPPVQYMRMRRLARRCWLASSQAGVSEKQRTSGSSSATRSCTGRQGGKRAG